MAKVHEGKLDGRGLRVAIVAGKFNHFIVDKLVQGALEALRMSGAADDAVEVWRTPGSFEIPLVAQRLARAERFDGILCLGAIIRGDTPHFEYIASEVAKGIAQVSLGQDVPVAFGVLTTDSVEQAIERAGTKGGNRGWDAAMSLLETIGLLREAKLDGKQA